MLIVGKLKHHGLALKGLAQVVKGWDGEREVPSSNPCKNIICDMQSEEMSKNQCDMQSEYYIMGPHLFSFLLLSLIKQ